jgi:Ca2+-transporting ATPase
VGPIAKEDAMKKWYQLDAKAVAESLDVDIEKGLSSAEAKNRLERFGPNELVERGAKGILQILWDQLTEIMVVLLIIAAIVSLLLGEVTDAIAIITIVVLNAILGVSQEYRAEQAIAALKRLAVPTVRVRRGGSVGEVSARTLVPGDIVLLEAGSFVPADGRVVDSANLRVEEAALTGESEAVEKFSQPMPQEELTIGDRLNMVFMGTSIAYGRGTLLITETGMQTELGNIAELLQTVEREPTPLQRRLDRLGKTLALVALGIIALVVILGLLRGEELEILFLTGISMAVAAVPEGLPAVVTITLALGSQRMLKRNALIRKLPAVETLGSVTVICSDKTGTLTENRMSVSVLDVANERLDIETVVGESSAVVDAELREHAEPPRRSLGLMLKGIALCNDAVLAPDADGVGQRTIGDPTEGALVVAAAQAGLDKAELEREWPRVAEVPFTSERKRMTTIHRVNTPRSHDVAPWGEAPYVAFCKGAVDSLLDITTHVWDGTRAVPLDEDGWRDRIQDANREKAENGQRVLGLAFRPVDEVPSVTVELERLESDMVFVGVIGMLDPPRPEVREAVRKAKTAGIRPVMITGDHPLTARHIAKELGISSGDQHLTGRDLASMSVDDLEEVVESMDVYARVSPEHKLNIVQALQDRGHIAAMTGDGVNDAPALKKADIGVAMGITGTDVSKEAADMVLLDDNFATIVAAIEEGRTIFDNIRKFIKYTLSSNVGELLVMFIAPFLGMPLPLLPLQILWINLVTDGLPGLALSVEPAERGIMKRRPFHPQESIFSRGLGRQVLWVGALIGLTSLGTGFYFFRQGDEAWRTMVFTTLTLAQLGNALALRSDIDSFFQIWRTNPMAIGSVVLTLVLQLLVVYVPFLQDIFGTRPLDLGHLTIVLLASSVVFVAIELRKLALRSQEKVVTD